MCRFALFVVPATFAAAAILGFLAGIEHTEKRLLADAEAYRSETHLVREMASFGFCPTWRGMTSTEYSAAKTCQDTPHDR
jgi:hypothetical protein